METRAAIVFCCLYSALFQGFPCPFFCQSQASPFTFLRVLVHIPTVHIRFASSILIFIQHMFYPARRSSLLIFLPNYLTSVSASAHVLSVPISLAFMSPSLCLFAHIYLLYYTLYTACPLSLLPFTSLLEDCALTMRFYSLSCPSLPITVYWFAFWVSVVTDTFPLSTLVFCMYRPFLVSM
jgi:hypothetical protein